MSLLKPEISLGVALATGTIVAGVYFNALPTLADVRTGQPGNRDVSSARKAAAWTSAGITAAISLIAKDPTVFAVGAATTVILDWWYRHGNAVDPRSGKATVKSALLSAETGPAEAMAPMVASADAAMTDSYEFVY